MAIRTTRRRLLLLFSGFLPLLSRFAAAQKPAAPATTAAVLDTHMQWMEQSFVPAAEAMPGDKFLWAPRRTCRRAWLRRREQSSAPSTACACRVLPRLWQAPPVFGRLRSVRAKEESQRKAEEGAGEWFGWP